MSKVILLEWPRSNEGVEMTPAGQLKRAKEQVEFYLDVVRPTEHPNEAITVAYAFGGYAPHG